MWSLPDTRVDIPLVPALMLTISTSETSINTGNFDQVARYTSGVVQKRRYGKIAGKFWGWRNIAISPRKSRKAYGLTVILRPK
jgi:hypothetical protein